MPFVPRARVVLFLFLCIALLTGCATPMRKLKPADLPNVPKSAGFYGGKMYPVPEWVYEGSTARYHHFRYSYTRDNLRHFIRVLVARSDMRLDFEQPKGSLPAQGVEVALAWDEARGGYYFVKPAVMAPADSDWLKFRDGRVHFNETLDLFPKTPEPSATAGAR